MQDPITPAVLKRSGCSDRHCRIFQDLDLNDFLDRIVHAPAHADSPAFFVLRRAWDVTPRILARARRRFLKEAAKYHAIEDTHG